MRRSLFARILSLAVLLATSQSTAQVSEDLQQCFLDLRSDAVVMNISAHPDDEDGSTLAYYRMKFGVQTHSILFTRGEGGQNEIGPELYDELAVIRTEETLRAGKILGTHVDFLNFPDFGFSKSATEAFRFWGGREETLRRLVYFVRKYKPDVLFTNHSTGGGHGHHQAVAVTAIAAFDAAGDSTMFPEQLKHQGLSIWQPGKLYVRTFLPAGGRPDVTHRTGDTHVASGKSYAEIASAAFREHKSQGMEGSNLARSTGGFTYYRLGRTISAFPADTMSFLGGMSIFPGVETGQLKSIRAAIDSLSPDMNPGELVSRCSRVLPLIRTEAQAVAEPRLARILGQWEQELERLIVAVCEISLSVTPGDSILVAGQEVVLTASVASKKSRVGLEAISLSPAHGWKKRDGTSANDGRSAMSMQLRLSPDTSAARTLPRVTQQYRPIEEDDAILVEFMLNIDGRSIAVTKSIVLDVAPPLELTVLPRFAWLPMTRSSDGIEFDYNIVNRFPHKIAGTIDIQSPPGWRGEPESFLIPTEDGSTSGTMGIVSAPDRAPEGTIRFVSQYASTSCNIRLVDVKVAPGVRLGIIRSYDTTIETVARNLDVPFTMLDQKEIATGDLSRFSSIVIDIRSYAVRDDLMENNERLLDYVRTGGNLIVFYQKTQDWKKEYAPYPFDLTRARITDEEAPVTVLQPQHPLVRRPNIIGPEDWTGWVQERGVYFPDNVPPEYIRILSSHDPDERPLDTGLIVADVGRGSYMFTSYVWYRQMKEANPGALRFFANMISYSRDQE